MGLNKTVSLKKPPQTKKQPSLKYLWLVNVYKKKCNEITTLNNVQKGLTNILFTML